MSRTKRVVVFGGTGFLRRRLVDRLLARDISVAIASRDPRLRYLGLRLAMIEQPELFESNQLTAAAGAIQKKWLHCTDSRNGWSTFETVEAELAEVEERDLASIDVLADMRRFFANRRAKTEVGRF